MSVFLEVHSVNVLHLHHTHFECIAEGVGISHGSALIHLTFLLPWKTFSTLFQIGCADFKCFSPLLSFS